jgi:hypothetical protein
MQNYEIEVMLDVKKNLPTGKRSQMVSYLEAQPGIRDAGFSEYVDRMMIVTYDATDTSATTVRSQVQGQLDTDGPATCLVSF